MGETWEVLIWQELQFKHKAAMMSGGKWNWKTVLRTSSAWKAFWTMYKLKMSTDAQVKLVWR